MQRRIENLSLFVLIGLVALRPLVGESYDPAGNTLTEALREVSDPKPLTTLVFDALILAAACGWFSAGALGSPRPYRRTGLEWGAGLVAVAAIASCFLAGNKRLAINATIDWLCLPLLAIVLVQLCREPWQRRLLLAALLASACVEAAQCLEQYFSFNETWAHYQSIKADFWARQGVELDSSKVQIFEQRMQAREATGFFPHSNVAASYLVLCAFAGLGSIATQWRNFNGFARNAAGNPSRDREGAILPSPGQGRFLTGAALKRLRSYALSGNGFVSFLCAVGTMLMLVGVVLARSLGALLSALAGLALWILARRFASWIDAHRARTWMIAWLCVIAGAGVVIGYGLCRGSLPGWSLTFRWQYWQASSKLIADHWMTGVGRENFGRHYLQYKSIESPEEIANPHDLFVQAASDWGLLGLVGILLMILQASFRFVTQFSARSMPVEDRKGRSNAPSPYPRTLPTRSARLTPRNGGEEIISSPTPSPRTLPSRATHIISRSAGEGIVDGNLRRSRIIVWTAGLLLVVTIGRLPLLGSGDPNFLYYSTVTTGIVWLLGFILFTGSSADVSSGNIPSLDIHVEQLSARATGAPRFYPARSSQVGTAVAVGLLAFLVHDMINFAMFVPSSATTFFAMLGYCLAGRSNEAAEAEYNAAAPSGRSWFPAAASVGALVIVFWIGLIPVGHAQFHLSAAQQAAGLPLTGSVLEHPASENFESASAVDPYDATAEIARAHWLIELAGTSPSEQTTLKRKAIKALSTAMERDPFNASIAWMRAKLNLELAQKTGNQDDYSSAVADAQRALDLYPLHPTGMVSLADVQAAAGEALRSETLLRKAIAHYDQAIKLDNQRLSWETLHRMRLREKNEISAKMRHLRELLGEIGKEQ